MAAERSPGSPKCQRPAQAERLPRREHPACPERRPSLLRPRRTGLGGSWAECRVPSSRLPGRLRSQRRLTRAFPISSFGETLTFPEIVVAVHWAVSSGAAERGWCPRVAVRGTALCEPVRVREGVSFSAASWVAGSPGSGVGRWPCHAGWKCHHARVLQGRDSGRPPPRVQAEFNFLFFEISTHCSCGQLSGHEIWVTDESPAVNRGEKHSEHFLALRQSGRTGTV